MDWGDAFERMSNKLFDWFSDLFEFAFITFPALPWLFLIPLFLSTPPPGEPEGYDGCTYWEDCLKELKSFRESSGPDKKQNKDASAEK